MAGDLGATSAQIALAWLLAKDGVIAIPKAASIEHVRENRAAADLKLSPEDMTCLDEAFPPPSRRVSLEML